MSLDPEWELEIEGSEPEGAGVELSSLCSRLPDHEAYVHQVETVEAFREGCNVLLVAGTGAGKTEAALAAAWEERPIFLQREGRAGREGDGVVESLIVARDAWTRYVVRNASRFERLYLRGMLESIPFSSLSPCSKEPKANPILSFYGGGGASVVDVTSGRVLRRNVSDYDVVHYAPLKTFRVGGRYYVVLSRPDKRRYGRIKATPLEAVVDRALSPVVKGGELIRFPEAGSVDQGGSGCQVGVEDGRLRRRGEDAGG